MLARDVTIRKMNSVQHLTGSLDYSYSYIGQGEYGYSYGVEDIRRREADAGLFPNNIQEPSKQKPFF